MCSNVTFNIMLSLLIISLLLPCPVSAMENKESHSAQSPGLSFLTSIWHSRHYLYSAAALLFGIWFSVKMALKKRNVPRVANSLTHKTVKTNGGLVKETGVHVSGVKIFYGSQTGTAKGFAKELSDEVEALGLPSDLIDMKGYDPDDQLADECTNKSVCVFLLATYTDGQPTENAEWFCKWLEEASTDFRYGRKKCRQVAVDVECYADNDQGRGRLQCGEKQTWQHPG